MIIPGTVPGNWVFVGRNWASLVFCIPPHGRDRSVVELFAAPDRRHDGSRDDRLDRCRAGRVSADHVASSGDVALLGSIAMFGGD